jgi:hypothetical protein
VFEAGGGMYPISPLNPPLRGVTPGKFFKLYMATDAFWRILDTQISENSSLTHLVFCKQGK